MVENNKGGVWGAAKPYVPPTIKLPEREEPKPLVETPKEQWTPKVPTEEPTKPEKNSEPVKNIIFTTGNIILSLLGVTVIIGIVIAVAVVLNSFYGVL